MPIRDDRRADGQGAVLDGCGRLFYNHNGLRVSFTQKYTGPQYASEYSGTGPRNYRIKPYSVGDFAISQKSAALPHRRDRFQRVQQPRDHGDLGGKTYGVDDQFNFLPPRSFLLDVRVKY
jgi:iron complex outermembrane receptor protein